MAATLPADPTVLSTLLAALVQAGPAVLAVPTEVTNSGWKSAAHGWHRAPRQGSAPCVSGPGPGSAVGLSHPNAAVITAALETLSA